jgi:hypothetical protein
VKPGGQVAHAALLVAPTAAENVPAGHRTQLRTETDVVFRYSPTPHGFAVLLQVAKKRCE